MRRCKAVRWQLVLVCCAVLTSPHAAGWTGFLIELQFEYADPFIAPRNHTLTVTSEMNTVRGFCVVCLY